jgi:hypothetical protein
MIEPVVIIPDALYDDSLFCLQLGLSIDSVVKGRRSGLLRFARVGKRTLYRGDWVMAWIEAVARPFQSVKADQEEKQPLARSVGNLNLSERARKCLRTMGVETLDELILRDQYNLRDCKNVGESTVNEVREKLARLGLKLKGE